MDRKEYDANLGLQEGRRKNPGHYKLPPQTYMSLGDVLMVMGAIVLAAAAIAHSPEIWSWIQHWWTVLSAGIETV